MTRRVFDDQTRLCEDAEMLRDRRPANTKATCNFADSARPTAELTQDGPARLRAERIELFSALTQVGGFRARSLEHTYASAYLTGSGFPLSSRDFSDDSMRGHPAVDPL